MMKPPKVDRHLKIGVVLLALNLVFPADVPFINDEQVFLERAEVANAQGTLPQTAAMTGNAGIAYGAAAIWIYQLLLLFTKDLPTLVFLKAAFSHLITFFALYRLSLAFGWSRIPVLWVLISAFFWFAGRVLWDNCFLVPLSAVFFSSGLIFLRTERPRDFWIVAVTGTFMLLLHLMAAAPVLAFGATLLLRKRAWLARSLRHAIPALVLCAGLMTPYLLTLSPGSGSGGGLSTLRPGSALANALLGFQFFTAVGFADRWVPQLFAGAAGGFFHVLSWLSVGGFFLAVGGLFVRSADRDIRFFLFLTLALVFVSNSALRLAHHKHYMNAVWPVFFVLIEWAATRCEQHRWGRPFLWAHTGVLALFLLGCVGATHWSGGNRTYLYGPVLGEQIRIARQLPRSGDLDGVKMEVDNFRKFPHAIGFLARRYGQVETLAPSVLRYKDREPGASTGWLELVPMR